MNELKEKSAVMTPMMAQYLQIKKNIRTICFSTGWETFTNCSWTMPL